MEPCVAHDFTVYFLTQSNDDDEEKKSTAHLFPTSYDQTQMRHKFEHKDTLYLVFSLLGVLISLFVQDIFV